MLLKIPGITWNLEKASEVKKETKFNKHKKATWKKQGLHRKKKTSKISNNLINILREIREL